MNAFDKVLKHIQNTPDNGHAIKNIQNIKSLTIAQKNIEKMMREVKLPEK